LSGLASCPRHQLNRLPPVPSTKAARLRRAGAALILLIVAPAALGADAPEVVIRPAREDAPTLTAQEKRRIAAAVEAGLTYLRRTQLPTGSWIIGTEAVGDAYAARCFAAGFAGLGGLALLESGVGADDPSVQRAARFIRLTGPRLFRTYDVTLAILFLDRLGDARDRPLLRSLALRLAAGQTPQGGWGYNCPLLTSNREKKLEKALRDKAQADLRKHLRPPPPGARQASKSDPADNSNTQFAILALAAARRQGLPLDFTIRMAELRFRLSQNAGGWAYNWWVGHVHPGYGSMTCAGLLALAVGRSAAREEPGTDRKQKQPQQEDPGIAWGLKVLGVYLRDPSDFRGEASSTGFGPRGAVNQYFLWSVERVGVLCGVKTIGGVDWYRWGAGLLVPTQRADGSWLGRGSEGYPAADTCFALLFLKRSDLLPDLRKQLAKRVRIVDPGPFVQGGPATKGPDLKGLIAADQGPLTADLGAVPAGKASPVPLRVRGPADFRITAIRGDDKQLKVQLDSQSVKVHDLTLTLHLDKAGPFERTLYLQTDLPGRAEVAVRVRATATPAAGPR
jgi:hypothetical protein